TYTLSIRDDLNRGKPAMTYVLEVGAVSVVTSVFPPGIQRGTEIDVQLAGVHLGSNTRASCRAPANATIGDTIPVSFTLPDGRQLEGKTLLVGEFPEFTEYWPA